MLQKLSKLGVILKIEQPHDVFHVVVVLLTLYKLVLLRHDNNLPRLLPVQAFMRFSVLKDARTKADSIVHDVARCRDTSKIGDRVENIHAVHYLVALYVRRNCAGICDDQGYPHTTFKRVCLPASERLIDIWKLCIICSTIVAHEDDDCLVLETKLSHFSTDASHIAIKTVDHGHVHPLFMVKLVSEEVVVRFKGLVRVMN